MKKSIGLNTNQLKYIALSFMVLDSAFFAFPGLPAWLHLITRFVAPLFAYLTLEGFFHTRNRKRHLLRLWSVAILMQIGDFLSQLLLGKEHLINDNIFLTLALGYSFLYFWQKARDHDRPILNSVLGSLIFLAGLFLSLIGLPFGAMVITLEGGIPILTLMLIFWAFYGHRRKQLIVFGIWSVISFLILGPDMNVSAAPSFSVWFEMFCYNSDCMSFLFLPFLFLYNGKKGSSKPIHKWFFYIFYPLHLWILHLLAFFL
ncbi:TraX family protein [Streptococcus sobrinus]|uniref:Conjugal transfer protein TraX n=4 Tax=Streptococcus sobrinus TaxID=1310 RepID=A0ABN5LH81_9STRE|nr:TraX family protein [Streptococcus sobrinus]AWN20251.1 conjugal transfer protein TraX [Streptococcus sobrinus]EMP72582.1 TraX family protein [Streptococcus sobrinus DSM 20742 = ATCC 33478]SQG12974.1 TraX family protein [Streptococcus sobrinus]